jgi:chemotaxis protein histidine kinase CheA
MSDTTAPAMGHNLPPTPTPSLRQIDRFKELRAVATTWHKLGSLPDDATADACKAFKDQVRILFKEIEAARVNAKAPYLAANRAIDKEFEVYLDSLSNQITAMTALETAYLKKKRDEKETAQRAAEAEARRAAEAAARIAEQAADAADFAAQDAVREAAAEAEQAQRQAEKIAETRVAIGADVIAGGRRKATTLRQHTVLDVADPKKVLAYLIKHGCDLTGINDALKSACRLHRTAHNNPEIPGLTVTIEERAQ